jgi:hypothetical protein
METMPDFTVGQSVIWDSRRGPVDAEYRGRQWGFCPDGPEACIVVRPCDGPPYQIVVPLSQVRPAEDR